MARYSPEPYKSDGGFTVVGLPILFLLLAVAGLILGGLAGFISRWFYLIFLFPMFIGLGLAAAGYFGGRIAKMRNLALGFVAGLFAGGLAMGTMHFVEYRHFVGVRDEALGAVQRAGGVPGELREAQAVSSFPAYLNYAAKVGVTLGGRRGGGFNLGYWGTWIYWTLELTGVTILAMLGTAGGALAPFCSRCDSWKTEKDLGRLSGDPELAQKLIEKGRVDELFQHRPGDVHGALLLSIHWCTHCEDRSDIDVKLQTVTTNDKGEDDKTELTHQTYPGEALNDFEALFSAAGISRRGRNEDRPRRRERDRDDEDDRPRRRDRDDEDRPRRATRDDDPPPRPAREDDDRPRRRPRDDDEDDRPRRRERRDDY